MGAGLLIFGAGRLAEVAAFYFSHDSQWSVAAHVVDDQFLESERLNGVDVLPWSEGRRRFPPHSHKIFVAMSYARMNLARSRKVRDLRMEGYEMPTFISSRASVASNVRIGSNCFILEHNTVQPFVTIGDNAFLWSGNHVGHHSTIEDDVFISSHVVISGSCRIGRGSFLGVNSTVQNGISIGEECFIGPMSLVQTELPPKAVVLAERARIQKVRSDHLRL